MHREIAEYGYEFSTSRFYKIMAGSTVGILVIGYLFQLRSIYLVILVLAMMIAVPMVIRDTYRDLYQQRRFDDLNNYLEQLMMSFKRHGNLLISLQETSQIFKDGILLERLEQVISYLEFNEEPDIYEKSFAIIEQEFNCYRLEKIHRFLIQIEKWGGAYQETLDLLAQERLLWVQRVYLLTKSQHQIEKNIYISALMASLIAAVMGIILPGELNIFDLVYVKVISLAYLLGLIAIVVVVRRNLTGRYFDGIQLMKKNEIDRAYELFGTKSIFGKNEIILLAVTLGLAVGAYLAGRLLVSLVLIMIGLIVGSKIWSRKKRMRQKIIKEIELAFPQWMLQVTLLLQNNNVHVSIEQSLVEAPHIMKGAITKFLNELQENPNSLLPYNDFLGEYNLSEVKSLMRALYALDINGNGESSRFLNELMTRNNKLVDKTERLYHENKIAFMGVLQYLPMLLATFKMMGDMSGFVLLLIGKMRVI